MAYSRPRPTIAAVREGVLDRRTSARVVLLLGVLSGISYTITTALMSPEQFGLATHVYVTATDAWLNGTNPYTVSPDHLPGYRFLYPPIVLLVFLPHALLDGALAIALQTVINLVAGLAIVGIIWRALERRGVALDRIDRVLILAFVLISPYGVPQLIQAQTTLWLALAFAIGFDAIDRDRERLSGFAFALAAIIKVFPAAVGLWLLRLRAWRAVAIAITTGISAILLGAVVLGPDLTVYYLTEVLLGRYEHQGYQRAADPFSTVGGVRRQLAGLFGLEGRWLTVVSLAVLMPILGLAYRHVETDLDRQTAALATVIALLLFLPLQPLYFPLIYFPLLVVLYRMEFGPARVALLVGILVTFVMIDLEPALAAIATLPPAVADPLSNVTIAAFTIALPPDIGMWALLLACVIYQRGR